jgi:hypothetical protein
MTAYNIVNPGHLVAGQNEDVSDVLANFQAIQSILNGNIDDTNVKAAAAIQISKLAGGGAGTILKMLAGVPSWDFVYDAQVAAGAAISPSKFAAGTVDQILGMLGGVPTWIPNVPARQIAGVDLNTSITETSIWTPAIAGNALRTDRMAIAILCGDVLHNNVAGDTVTLRIKFGGTTFYAVATSFNAVASALRQPWVIIVFVMNLGATNSQMIFGLIGTHDANEAAPTTGIGNINLSSSRGTNPVGAAALGAIDTTVSQNLDITAQWSASSVNNSFRSRGGVLFVK